MRGARRAPPSVRCRVRTVHEFARARLETAGDHGITLVDGEEDRAARLTSPVDDALRRPGFSGRLTGTAAFPTANRLAWSVVRLPLCRPTDEARARRPVGATDD